MKPHLKRVRGWWLCVNRATLRGNHHVEATYGETPASAYTHFMQRYRGWPRTRSLI